MNIHDLFEDRAKKQHLDAKCWTGYHKAGTKVKGDTRVNNCVPNESTINEFAPPGGDDGGPDEDEILFRLAKQWWLGTESDMIRVERTLASMGWEIGEDEGSYDDGGVFVVRAGDVNGRSYQSWPHEELVMDEGVWDTIKKSFTPDPNWQKRAGHMAQGAVAGSTHGHAVGHAMADAGVAEGSEEINPEEEKLKVLQGTINNANIDSVNRKLAQIMLKQLGTTATQVDEMNRRGFLKGVGAVAGAAALGGVSKDANAQSSSCKATLTAFNGIHNGMSYYDVVRIIGCNGSVLSDSEMAGFKTTMYGWSGKGGFLQPGANMNLMVQNGKVVMKAQFGLKESVNQGVAEDTDPWGPEGRYVGDTGPAQITTTVAKHEFKPGDRVVYTPTGQHAKIEDLNKDRTMARIHVASAMGGKYFNCKVSDLKAMGSLREKSTSQAQFRTMAAAAHDPKFAKKVGIKQSVAQEFHGADKKQSYKSLPKKVDEGIMDFMQPKQPKTTKDKLSLSAMRQIEKARFDKDRKDPTYVRSVDLPKNPDHVRVVTDGRGDYVPPKEADYGDDYQDMVRRVAAQEKRKQQRQQPPKKEDSNMPVAVDSTSPIHGTNEDSEQLSKVFGTKQISPSSRELIRTARRNSPDATSDIDAVFAYLDDVAKRTQDNYGRVNDILQQLDPMSNDLDKAERELSNVRQVNQGQQQLLGRLKARLDKGGEDNAPAQAQQATQDKKDADERDTINKQLDQEPKQVVVKQEPQGPVDAVDKVARQKADQAERDIQAIHGKDAQKVAKKAVRQVGANPMLAPTAQAGKIDPATVSKLLDPDFNEDIYESRLYKMKLAGYFD